MKRLLILASLIALIPTMSFAADKGMISKKSHYSPKLGSHFFTSNQTAGIDLPMKALAWKDKKGQVWLTYNDPTYIANRHSIGDRPKIVKKMTGALNKLTNVATGNK